jgi:hypothetical protein
LETALNELNGTIITFAFAIGWPPSSETDPDIEPVDRSLVSILPGAGEGAGLLS